MGFPLIMYLSRSKTIAIWPDLGRKKEALSLRDVSSTMSVSLTPKVDVVAEWKKVEEAPLPSRDTNIQWPPSDSLEICASIEKNLRKRNQVGSMSDFLRGDFKHPCYKLFGFLTLDEKLQSVFRFGGISLNTHGLTGIITLFDTQASISVILALENIAGVSYRDDQWHIWESGALHLFGWASTPKGYPLFGLLTFQGLNPNAQPSCGIVYFASASEYRMDERSKKDDDLKTIASGIDTWPNLLKLYS